MREISKQLYISPIRVAEIYAALGDQEQAVAWLEKAAEERVLRIIFLKVEPIFDSLRSHPKFTDLVRRIGLAR